LYDGNRNIKQQHHQEEIGMIISDRLVHPIVFPEIMQSLSELYAVGLSLGTEQQPLPVLHQHILTYLRRIIRASGAYLLLYQPIRKQFLPTAYQGPATTAELLAAAIHAEAMQRLALQGPGEVLTPITLGEQHMVIITLSCNAVFLGVIVLALDDASLLDERTVLLSAMGNIAALLLHNYDLRLAQQRTAIEQERSRIARDIHDSALQHVVHALHKLEFIQHLLNKQQTQLAYTEIIHTPAHLDSCLRDLRQSVSSLLPTQLSEKSLVAALQSLLEDYRVSNPGIRILDAMHAAHLVPSTLEVPIFHFVQESLNNVRKHAHATCVTLHIHVIAGLLTIEVDDNGIGFQLEEHHHSDHSNTTARSSSHIGLRSMRERIQQASGSWEIQSQPGTGTSVKARFPLHVTPETLTNREHEVLRLLIEGMTNRAIAAHLSISNDTVKSHIHHIMRKMQVKDRTQAAVLATRQGWL